MTEEQKNNILCTASQFGSMEIITYLIEKYPEIPADYTKALVYACFGGQLETTVFLVEMGADIHSDDAFCKACSRGYENIVRYFVKNEPKISRLTSRPLFEAAANGHKEVCRLLVESGSFIDDRFDLKKMLSGGTPVWAAKKNLLMHKKEIPCFNLLKKYKDKNINEIALELSDKLIYSSSKKERDKVIKELNQLLSEYPIVGNIIEKKIHQSKNND